MDKIFKSATLALVINVAFGAYHIAFGIIESSWWLFTVGIYYAILSLTRFYVIITQHNEAFIKKITGIMLMILSVPLAGTVILAFVKDRGTVFHEIIMISIALYAFVKITLATVNLIKARRNKSKKELTLRNISFASAFVSIFSLQRSMLVSFEGMEDHEILIMNLVTGTAVSIIVFLLGLNLIYSNRFFKE